MSDLPVVSIWDHLTGATYAKLPPLGTWTDLSFEPRHLQPGPWSLTVPYDEQALRILPDRLVSFDWRSTRFTGVITELKPVKDERGIPTLQVAGAAAVGMLGWATAWRDPAAGPDDQPAQAALLSGPAETVIRDVVRANMVTRRGDRLTVPASAGTGATIRCRPDLENLFDLVAAKAKRGGIGVDVQLVNTSGTRAVLTLETYVPEDRSGRVRLSERVGTVRGWENVNTAPAATRVFVPGSAGVQVVTTPESVATAATWGGHREQWLAPVNSFDPPDLEQAGNEALDGGAATTSLTVTAAEAEGMRAFTHYRAGDIAAAELTTGLAVTDVISGIEVRCDTSGPVVTPKFGDPDADDPFSETPNVVAALQRDVRQLQTRS